MTTKATPLSAVKINLLLSYFNLFRALYSSLLMFIGPLLWFCFSILFTSTLNSSCFPCSSLVQVCSIAVIYSLTSVSLGVITNCGPWASNFSWSSVSGVLDRFITHFFLSALLMFESIALFFQTSLFEQPLVFHCTNASHFALCLSKTLLCLHSMTLFIKLLHSSMESWSNTLSCWCKYESLLYMSISIMLLIDLIHSLSNCFFCPSNNLRGFSGMDVCL